MPDENNPQVPPSAAKDDETVRAEALAQAHGIAEEQARQLVRTIGESPRELDTVAEAQKRWS